MTRSDTATDNVSPSGTAPDAEGTTLESFVAQLHRDGVEAGQKEAEAVVRAAEEEAEEILRRARGEARSMVAEAERAAERAEARGRDELQLAVRDGILQLEASLTAVLRALIVRSVDDELTAPDGLKPLLKEVVGAYARADAAGRPTEFRVPARVAQALEGWWTRELGAAVAGDGTVPELVGDLEAAGFEYQVAGGTVEVSVDSVVDTLVALIRPGLREVVQEAAGRGAEEVAPAREEPAGLAGVGGAGGS